MQARAAIDAAERNNPRALTHEELVQQAVLSVRKVGDSMPLMRRSEEGEFSEEDFQQQFARVWAEVEYIQATAPVAPASNIRSEPVNHDGDLNLWDEENAAVSWLDEDNRYETTSLSRR
jgi:hypothetical protein